jgi:thermitase
MNCEARVKHFCRNLGAMSLGVLFVGFAQTAYAGEYIVKLKKDGVSASSIMSIKNVTVKDREKAADLLKVDIKAGSLAEEQSKIAELKNRKDVQYVVKNIKLHAFSTPDDPRFEMQWALEKIRATAAWDVSSGSGDVTVAVIDTGIDLKHEDLAANIWVNPGEIPGNNIDDDHDGFVDDVNGWDFHDNDASPQDETSDQNPGHGTHCAGIVGAVGNNGIGVTGINETVKILALRFLGSDGSGDLFDSVKAIDYAIARGVDVISASWGAAVSADDAAPLVEAIGRANDAGILFVAAASNDGQNNDVTSVYPANAGLPNVISVAASDESDSKPFWSNYGRHSVDLAAPGDDILSTLPGNSYGKLRGTSMATPLVAGLAALLKSIDLTLAPVEIRSILQASGVQVDIETACSCRIDAQNAANLVQSRGVVVVPNATTVSAGQTKQFSAWGGTAPYTFASSNDEIATVSAEGLLTAVSEGKVIVTATDANGEAAPSSTIYVRGQGDESPEPSPGKPPIPGLPPLKCPFDPEICDLLCMFDPAIFPWCDGDSENALPVLPELPKPPKHPKKPKHPKTPKTPKIPKTPKSPKHPPKKGHEKPKTESI